MVITIASLIVQFIVVLSSSSQSFTEGSADRFITASRMDNVTFSIDNRAIPEFIIGRFLHIEFKKNDNIMAMFIYGPKSCRFIYLNNKISHDFCDDRHGRHIKNFTIGLAGVQSNDSDTYSLVFLGFNTSITWNLYVLDMAQQEYSNRFIEEGSLMTNEDFPSLTDDVIDRMQLSTVWLFAGKKVGSGNLIAEAHRSVHGDNMTYVITDLEGNSTSVEFPLNIAYITPIRFEMDDSMHTTVRCHADCNPECSIVWYYNDQQITENGTLILQPGSMQTVGEYSCLATISATLTKRKRSLLVLNKYVKEQSKESLQSTVHALGGIVGLLAAVVVFLTALAIYAWRRRALNTGPVRGGDDTGKNELALESLGMSSSENYQSLNITTEEDRQYESIAKKINQDNFDPGVYENTMA